MVRKASNVERSKQKESKEDPVDQREEEADVSASASKGISKSPIKVSVTITQNNEPGEENFSPQTEADEGEENKKTDTPVFVKETDSKSIKASKTSCMNGTPIKYLGSELAKEVEELDNLCLEGSKVKEKGSQTHRTLNIGVQIDEDTSKKSKNSKKTEEQIQVIIKLDKSPSSKVKGAASPMKSKGEKSPVGKSNGKKTPPPFEDTRESKKLNTGRSKVESELD